MKKIMYSTYLLLGLSFLPYLILGQQPEDLVFKVQTSIQESPPSISFTWDAVPGDSVITICRKDKEASDWGDPVAVLGHDATEFTDNDVEIGVEYEYRILKESSMMGQIMPVKNYTTYEEWYEDWSDEALENWLWKSKPIVTYISSGIKMPELEYRGKVILLVDSNFVDSLRNELSLFETDLLGDGWKVLRKDISRNASVRYVKSVVRDIYYSDTVNVKSLILFGHIPVPLSGCLAPDGHWEEVGAWQADLYYGSMNEAIWTDEMVDIDTMMQYRRIVSNNIPGDGKFDVSVLPDDKFISLRIGRIDLSKMPVFSNSEAELLKKYLQKNHAFRHKIINPKFQAVIDDYWGWCGGFVLGLGAIRNFTALVSAPKIETGNYFHKTRTDSYLFSHENGYGDVEFLGTEVNPNGRTGYFVQYKINSVFTSFFSSCTGNWDYPNNFLRAPLASDGWPLTSCWQSRPNYTFHQMGMGNTIGYCVLVTQNNLNTYDFNAFNRGIHIGMQGDPTLHMQMVCPVNSLQSAITSGNTILLAWKPSDDSILGYHVYKLDTVTNEYNRLTTDPVTDTWYEDTSPVEGNNYYMVKSYALTESASGSYYNLSQGVFDTLKYTEQTPIPVTGIELYADPENTLPLLVYDPFCVKAHIVPEDATNPLLKWSVLNSTANGKFDVTGDILADKGGLLTVIAEALDGSEITDSLEIFIDSIPDAAGPITGATEACRDSKNRMYTVSEIRGAKYFLWNYPNGKNDTTVLNESNYAINNTAVSGTIYVSGLNPFGTGESSSLDITVYDIPPAPEITLEGNTLHSDAPEGNQWYLNDNLIEGATGQDYVAVDSGSYYAKVTLNGCTSTKSNKIIYDPTGIDHNEGTPSVTIYPNPATNQLFVEFEQPVNPKTTLELMDITGKVVFSANLGNNMSMYSTDISALAKGIYFLKISNREFTLTEKVVKY